MAHPTLARPDIGDPETPGKRLRTTLRLAAAAMRLRLIRYEIAEDSMEPTLRSGDWTLGEKRPRRVEVGEVIVIDHPSRPGFALAKRVQSVGPAGIEVRGDHAPHSVDSRDFGAIPAGAVLARLMLVYHPGRVRVI